MVVCHLIGFVDGACLNGIIAQLIIQFSKREFMEYLNQVSRIPRLTRFEWNVIKSSLGQPRRFSEHFLIGEKDKLKQYRESVRKHYSELRTGVRDELPIDLAKSICWTTRNCSPPKKERFTMMCRHTGENDFVKMFKGEKGSSIYRNFSPVSILKHRKATAPRKAGDSSEK
ncbi:hypothetical protein VNO78_18368 [Psophocarpus tetragonolobus]|uniref:DIRP domain-containing protein n=1 Tax=Psophocarpus tetragonolobus TaxID=3891 RepID=A0AAN9SIN6_PSOTE